MSREDIKQLIDYLIPLIPTIWDYETHLSESWGSYSYALSTQSYDIFEPRYAELLAASREKLKSQFSDEFLATIPLLALSKQVWPSFDHQNANRLSLDTKLTRLSLFDAAIHWFSAASMQTLQESLIQQVETNLNADHFAVYSHLSGSQKFQFLQSDSKEWHAKEAFAIWPPAKPILPLVRDICSGKVAIRASVPSKWMKSAALVLFTLDQWEWDDFYAGVCNSEDHKFPGKVSLIPRDIDESEPHLQQSLSYFHNKKGSYAQRLLDMWLPELDESKANTLKLISGIQDPKLLVHLAAAIERHNLDMTSIAYDSFEEVITRWQEWSN